MSIVQSEAIAIFALDKMTLTVLPLKIWLVFQVRQEKSDRPINQKVETVINQSLNDIYE
ncbi:MAG: hypothetical protein QNJ38_09750 [Prochloraceae cyanobacterium]|nr:hypothetical protein [Prochloraceae cyanobacterium]